MNDRWADYTERVRIGDYGHVAHLSNGSLFTACQLGDQYGGGTPAPDDWPLCKACERAIEAGKRRAQAEASARCPYQVVRAWPDCYEDCSHADTINCPHQAKDASLGWHCPWGHEWLSWADGTSHPVIRCRALVGPMRKGRAKDTLCHYWGVGLDGLIDCQAYRDGGVTDGRGPGVAQGATGGGSSTSGGGWGSGCTR